MLAFMIGRALQDAATVDLYERAGATRASVAMQLGKTASLHAATVALEIQDRDPKADELTPEQNTALAETWKTM